MIEAAPHAASIRYHLAELEIVRNLEDARRSVPVLGPEEKCVLDVGCGIGQTLLAHEVRAATLRCGIDVDAAAIEYGQRQFPFLDLRTAPAERIPFAVETFDLVISRVALPYTNLPLALREAHRVLRPGGRLWALLHPWRMERRRILTACASDSARDILDRLYVSANSALLHVVGYSLPRPWSGQHETVQTARGIRKALERAHFTGIELHCGRHFRIEARRA